MNHANTPLFVDGQLSSGAIAGRGWSELTC
jgi:hypothetical protein